VLSGPWEELADRIATDPFGRPGWFRAWGAAFVPQAGIGAVAVEKGDELVGIAPVVGRRSGWAYPADIHTPTASLPAASGEARAALVDGLLRERPGEVLIPMLRAADPVFAVLRERAPAHGYRALEIPRGRSPVLHLDGVDDGLSSLSRKRRKELRRLRRRLEDRGALTVATLVGADRLEATVDEAVALEARQWKGAAGTAIASDPRTERWIRLLCREAAATGSLRLVTLRLDGRLIAFAIGLNGPRANHSLKSGFDPDFADYSPGHLVTAAEIDRAIADGVERFEFLGGMEPYKRAWTDDADELVSVALVPRGARGAPAHVRYGPVRRMRCRASTHVLTRRFVSWPFP
jgi:CelD/BcsL family acetyltransferase involved in cellulose biosynthesis